MANTSPATCQCLATFTPLKSKILIFFRDVISLLARVFIFLIDRATQEVPMNKYLKEIVGPVTGSMYAKVCNDSLNITLVLGSQSS